VRRIHEECKEGYQPEESVVEEIKKELGPLYPAKPENQDGQVTLYRGKGDAECGNTGYLGRIGIFEVMPISEKIAKLILQRSPASEIEKQAKEEGMITMKQDGYLKVLEGITTVEEVLRVAQE
jgi:type II secretory ATPase GspE/PulE/Tfp pilus assembly ATPase PilB-like protein